MERTWVPGASLVRVDVRTGTSGPHLILRQTRGARGRGDHESGGRVDKAMHSGRLSLTIIDARWKHPYMCIVAGPTGCGKSTFVTRMLRDDRSTPPPRKHHVVLR